MNTKEINDNNRERQKSVDISKVAKQYSDAISEQGKIVDLQKQINEAGKLTPEIIESAISLYPEIGASVSNLSTLQDYLNGKINETKTTQQQAFESMVSNDENYFANSVKNTDTWKQLTSTVMQEMAGVNAQYYQTVSGNMETDLNNCKTLNEAKFEIEKATIVALTKLWEEYYAYSYTATDGSKFEASKYYSNGRGGYDIPDADKSKIDEYNTKKQQLLDAQKKMENAYNASVNYKAPDFSSGDFSTDKKSGTDKKSDTTKQQVADLESLVDR